MPPCLTGRPPPPPPSSQFCEAYFVFAVGNLSALWKVEYKNCWKGIGCPVKLSESITYTQVCGIIFGQLVRTGSVGSPSGPCCAQILAMGSCVGLSSSHWGHRQETSSAWVIHGGHLTVPGVCWPYLAPLPTHCPFLTSLRACPCLQFLGFFADRIGRKWGSVATAGTMVVGESRLGSGSHPRRTTRFWDALNLLPTCLTCSLPSALNSLLS